MDEYIAALPFTEDGDLRLCAGVAYQADMSIKVEYGQEYWDKYLGYEGQCIANAINAGRVALVDKFCNGRPVLDIGVGSGEFIKSRSLTWGVDVNPVAKRWLYENRLWADDLRWFAGYTFWDVIEHVPRPADYFDRIAPGAYLFTSVPIFADLNRVRESKHYRPGEHLYYWTEQGFVRWMQAHGFELLERQAFEIEAGREEIYSFAFRRVAHG